MCSHIKASSGHTATYTEENIPCECPVPGHTASLWVLHIKSHLARYHPNVAPNTVELTEWVVVSQDDEKKGGQAKKISMLMKPKITLKVAKAVDNEGASFSEASLGRLVWELKPEEDASSTHQGLQHIRIQDSSDGNESSASSEDGNSTSSSSSSSSSPSSSGVEVHPKKKAVPKQPIITPKHNAKKQRTVKMSGLKK